MPDSIKLSELVNEIDDAIKTASLVKPFGLKLTSLM